MRAQVYIIAILISVITWGVAYHASRDVYRAAQRADLIPDLHLRENLKRLI